MRSRSCLLAFAMTLVYSTLFCAVVTASRPGYRCGERIYTQEFLENSAEQAQQTINQYIEATLSTTGVFDFDQFTLAYKGSLDFVNNGGNMFSWPLSIPQQGSSENTSHFLIINSNPLRIIGVIRQHGDRQVKCIRELDLSDVYDNNYAIGYRCPHEVFRFKIIQDAIEDARQRDLERTFMNPMPKFPKKLQDLQIFGEVQDVWSWPILSNGKFGSKAVVSVIMDKDFELIGLVHSRKGEHLRCLLTVFDQITPKFIGKALEQQPRAQIGEYADVFQCDREYLLSSQILASASEAPKRFLKNMQTGLTAWYPLPYEPSSDSASPKLFKWPVKIDKAGKYHPTSRFSRFEKVFAIINEFSDVEEVIIKLPRKGIANCERKSIFIQTYIRYLHRKSDNYFSSVTAPDTASGTAS